MRMMLCSAQGVIGKLQGLKEFAMKIGMVIFDFENLKTISKKFISWIVVIRRWELIIFLRKYAVLNAK